MQRRMTVAAIGAERSGLVRHGFCIFLMKKDSAVQLLEDGFVARLAYFFDDGVEMTVRRLHIRRADFLKNLIRLKKRRHG